VLEAKSIMSEFPKVIPEHLFVQIAEEVERFHADVGAFELALEQAPEVFHTVSVDLTVNVFFRMVDNLVLESLLIESHVGHERVGVDRAARLDVSANIGLQHMLFAIADYSGANLTATFKDALNGSFVFGASVGNPALALIGVHVSGEATNESFVYFNLSTGTAEFQERANLHGEPDAVEHEPSRLLSYAKSAANLIRANAILAVGNHPNGNKPLVERQSGILKDSPNLGGELFLGVLALALPHPASGNKANVIPATSGAFDAIRPAPRNHEIEAVVGVGEVNDGLLESFGLGVHGVPHCQNTTRNALLSQVYYCQIKR